MRQRARLEPSGCLWTAHPSTGSTLRCNGTDPSSWRRRSRCPPARPSHNPNANGSLLTYVKRPTREALPIWQLTQLQSKGGSGKRHPKSRRIIDEKLNNPDEIKAAEDRKDFQRSFEWFGVNLPQTLKPRAVLARFRSDAEAMLCYEPADWASLPPHVRLDITSRIAGYQEVCDVTDREGWPNLDDADWAVLSELTEMASRSLFWTRRTISGPSNTVTGAATDMRPAGYITDWNRPGSRPGSPSTGCWL